jgi:hypothetical protein
MQSMHRELDAEFAGQHRQGHGHTRAQ